MTDFMYATRGAIFISKKAREVLSPFVNGQVQFIQAHFPDDKNYQLMNLLVLLDCVNHAESELTLRKSKSIKFIDKLVLDEDKIKSVDPKPNIFRLEQMRPLIIINEKLAKAIEEAGLTGVECTDVAEFVL